MAIYKLKDIAEVKMCRRILSKDTSSVGEVPFYKIGTLGSTPDAFISKKIFIEYKKKYSFPEEGSSLISCSGTIGKVIVYDGKPAYFQDSNIVWIVSDLINKKYLYYWLLKKPFTPSEGSTIKRLYNSDILKTAIFLPSIKEQQKLIDIIEPIISVIDRAITIAKDEIKNIDDLIYWLTFDKNNVLKVVNLGSLITEVNKTKGSRIEINNVYSSTKNSLVAQSDYFNTNVSSKNTNKYKIVNKHNLVMSPQNLWMGNINISFLEDPGIVSPSYKVYEVDSNVNYTNLQSQLKSDVLINQYINASRQGASKVRRTLDMNQFKGIRIYLHDEKTNDALETAESLKNNLLSFISNYNDLKLALINKLIK